MTEYVVLTKDDSGFWSEVGREQASSPHRAIRLAIEGRNANGKAYAAVPARSWKPVTVKVETKTALKFS